MTGAAELSGTTETGSVAEWQNFFNEGNFLPFGFSCRNLPVSFCAFLVSSCPSAIDPVSDGWLRPATCSKRPRVLGVRTSWICDLAAIPFLLTQRQFPPEPGSPQCTRNIARQPRIASPSGLPQAGCQRELSAMRFISDNRCDLVLRIDPTSSYYSPGSRPVLDKQHATTPGAGFSVGAICRRPMIIAR